MEKFSVHTGLLVPLDRPNDDWRYKKAGEPGMDHSQREINPDFVLNQAQYQGASVLIARENFGCGSSREHAVWALADYGIRAVIAPSYADIFFNNSFKNGLLPVILSEETVDKLFLEINNGYELTIDLEQQKVITPSGEAFSFEVDAFRKHCMLNGLDDIGLTLQHADDIRAYEEKLKQEAPWLMA